MAGSEIVCLTATAGLPCRVIKVSNGSLYSQPTTPFSVTHTRLKKA